MNELSFEDLDTYLLRQNSKIIHQIWFGTIPTKRKAAKTLKKLKPYRDSWINRNPGWCYICWDLDMCSSLVKTLYSQHLEMYKKYSYAIQRCDVARYFILHRYGGLYADMDYFCNKSWNHVVEKYKNNFYLVETPNTTTYVPHVSNSLMYCSKPGHVFWNVLFIELELKQSAVPYYYSRHVSIMFTTGPGILNRVFHRYRLRYKLTYYPYTMFHPYGLDNDIKILSKKPNVYAIHLGRGSWETKDSKLLIFFYQEYKIILFIILVFIVPLLAI